MANSYGQIAASAPRIQTGTAGSAVKVDLTNGDGRTAPDWMAIQNVDSADALQFSFDGTNFATVAAGESFSIDDPGRILYIQAAAGSPDYEIITTYRRYRQ